MRLIDADALGLTDFEIVMCEGSYKAGLKMILDKIQKAPTIEPRKWIPCSERLPVICEYDVNGQKTFSCRVLSTQAYGNGLVFVGSDRYTSDRGWLSEVLDENGAPESKVIAWMPLPDPWKEAKE